MHLHLTGGILKAEWLTVLFYTLEAAFTKVFAIYGKCKSIQEVFLLDIISQVRKDTMK